MVCAVKVPRQILKNQDDFNGLKDFSHKQKSGRSGTQKKLWTPQCSDHPRKRVSPNQSKLGYSV